MKTFSKAVEQQNQYYWQRQSKFFKKTKTGVREPDNNWYT